MGLGKTVFALALLIFWQHLESSPDGSAPPAGAEEGSQGSMLSTDNMQHEQPLPPDSPHQPRSQQMGIDIPATEESEAEHDGDDEEDGGEAHEDPASTNDRATRLKRRTAQAIRTEAKINQAKSLTRGIAKSKVQSHADPGTIAGAGVVEGGDQNLLPNAHPEAVLQRPEAIRVRRPRQRPRDLHCGPAGVPRRPAR